MPAMPQADKMDGEQSITPEALKEATAALDRNGKSWRMAIEWSSGAMIKATSTEDQARQLVKALRKREAEAKKAAEATPRDAAFCVRCKEEFPIADDPGRKAWEMGSLNKVKFAPKRIRDAYKEWTGGDLHGEPWMCGSCYHDIDDGAPMHLM